jgi:hypothetical protein
MSNPTPALIRLMPHSPANAATVLGRLSWQKAKVQNLTHSGQITSVWESPHYKTLLSWVDDAIAECEYFLVGGPDRAAAVVSLEREIDFYTQTEVLTAIGEAIDETETGRSARRLGLLASGPFDLAVFQVLAGLLNCRSPNMQRDALIAIGYSAWPEFAAAFDSLENDAESSPEVRKEARQVRSELEKSDWNANFRA